MSSVEIDVSVVFSSAANFIQSNVSNVRQRSFLLDALDSLQNEMSQEAYLPFIHIPMFIYGAIRDELSSAYPLAVTTTLLFLGIDIIDDLADGDDRKFWDGYSRDEINLAAMLLLCSLPQLSISRFNISPKSKNGLHQTLAESFLLMGSGQQFDLGFTKSSHVTVDEVEKSVIAKTGEELALFASLAANYAGATKKQVKHYTEFARHLGTAIQFSTDCYDLFEASYSRDLTHGTRTLPIVFHLERKKSGEREVFIRELAEAERDVNCHENLRMQLRASGDLHRVAFVIELYCRRALNALDKAHPKELAKIKLLNFVDFVSLLRKRATNNYQKAEETEAVQRL